MVMDYSMYPVSYGARITVFTNFKNHETGIRPKSNELWLKYTFLQTSLWKLEHLFQRSMKQMYRPVLVIIGLARNKKETKNKTFVDEILDEGDDNTI